MRDIKFNSQKNNFSFAGKFGAFSQCMSTSVWMFLGFFIPQIPVEDDKALASFIAEVEIQVNPVARIALDAMHRWNWIKGFSSQWWLTQVDAIQTYFAQYGVNRAVVYREIGAGGLGLSPGTLQDLIIALANGPVVAHTYRMGGLPGGHAILINEYRDGMFNCNDPFGNANTNYADPNGKGVDYAQEVLIPAMERATGRPGQLRYVFAR